MFRGIEVNENCRKQYNKELLQLLGDLCILSLVRVSQWNLIGHVNRMNGKRKVGHLFHI